MTNQPPTIKRMEEEFNKKVGDVEKFRKLGRLRSGASGELAYENFYYEIKSFFKSYLSEVLDWLVADLADIGYTVEVLEDYLIDKQNVQAKKHVAHIKGQLTELNAKIAYIARKK